MIVSLSHFPRHTAKLSIFLLVVLVSEAWLTWSIADAIWGWMLINVSEAEVSVKALGVEQLRLGTIFYG